MAPKKNRNSTSTGDTAVLIKAPYLYLGPRTSASASFVAAHGITHVLSIGSTPPSTLPGVEYHRLSLSDDLSSPLDKVISGANDIISAVAAMPSGRILLHCSAAVSRSPTVVAAYLVSKCQMSLKAALGVIINARPAVCPNTGFLAQLKELEMTLRGECSLDVDILPAKKTDRVAMFKSG
ncbi:protein-tyrosine phosphatase-like protein [Mycena sp. CBHHK59/15]|nr:protein-tyrosine phosphatase-like protein [Mycena sp. CBHHK59/15]